MELSRIYSEAKMGQGSNLFIKNGFKTHIPARATQTDIKFQDLVEGYELDIIMALLSYNIIVEVNEDGTRKSIYLVDGKQEDFDIEGLFFLITIDNKTEYDVPVIIVFEVPFFSVKINNKIIHTEFFADSDLELHEVDTKKKQLVTTGTDSLPAVQYLTTKIGTRVLFNQDIAITTVNELKVTFKKGIEHNFTSVGKKTIEIGGFVFRKSDYYNMVGN